MEDGIVIDRNQKAVPTTIYYYSGIGKDAEEHGAGCTCAGEEGRTGSIQLSTYHTHQGVNSQQEKRRSEKEPADAGS
jgi:hypothetical protein